MSWSEQFDEPIDLTKDIALCSLRDAANYFIDLPASESIGEHWQLAMRFLVRAAEGKGSVWLARIAVVRALDHEKRTSTLGKLRNREPNVGLQIGL